MTFRSCAGLLLAIICMILVCRHAEAGNVGVGIYVQNAAQIDVSNGRWLGEAMIYFWDNETQTQLMRRPYVANFGGTPSISTAMPSLFATKLQQVFLFRPDPNEYPFDSQYLEVAIEDYQGATIQNITYYWLPGASGVSPYIRLIGWDWDSNTRGSAVVRNRTYYGGVYTVSQISWTFVVTRTKLVAVQVFLPPFFVLSSVLISFIMPITSSITRIGITGSALIAEVALHSGYKSANGTVGTMGLVDYFFLLTYLILVISLGINVFVMILLRDNPKSPLATYLESRVKYFVWFVCPGLYTFIFFRGKMVWAAVICLVGPIALYAVFELLLPRMRAAARKKFGAPPKARDASKDDAIYDEEVEARMQEGEGTDTVDTRAAAVTSEIAKKSNRRNKNLENSDSVSANLYDTDSE